MEIKIIKLDDGTKAKQISNARDFDYILENGEQLHNSEWNGECYSVQAKYSVTGMPMEYWPVYIPIGDPEDEQWDVAGFALGRSDRDTAERLLGV